MEILNERAQAVWWYAEIKSLFKCNETFVMFTIRTSDIQEDNIVTVEMNNDRESKTNSARKVENPHDNAVYVASLT
ncbi:hypothetical protein ANN_12994 [Periplaneta americana]|uniref:Uncharacterized protein n=1 Tax=Periplaneta americana TaxID=6978 RepID=A0ABQ8TKA5_PERAM|nr:hypothetical protein ANN_12994 [Periplaneta americana]